MTVDASPAAASRAQADRAVTVAWVVLSAITVASWWLAPAHGDHDAVASIPITLAVIALGVIKGRLIIRYFMEVRTAPRWLRWATDGWLAVLWAAVLAIYLY
ncbi:cytochrome C oxidase subunit IV family protein [Mycobacterium sp. NPDC050041]|uniref:cytochrome C oxidase subunit IV family protein n=1 Tax=Mycobacterium sp. NPDC050041 TaxID=3364293 RepID=UPI003C2D1564